MYYLDTWNFHPGKLNFRLLVRTGKLNCNLKLYTNVGSRGVVIFNEIAWQIAIFLGERGEIVSNWLIIIIRYHAMKKSFTSVVLTYHTKQPHLMLTQILHFIPGADLVEGPPPTPNFETQFFWRHRDSAARCRQKNLVAPPPRTQILDPHLQTLSCLQHLPKDLLFMVYL